MPSTPLPSTSYASCTPIFHILSILPSPTSSTSQAFHLHSTSYPPIFNIPSFLHPYLLYPNISTTLLFLSTPLPFIFCSLYILYILSSYTHPYLLILSIPTTVTNIACFLHPYRLHHLHPFYAPNFSILSILPKIIPSTSHLFLKSYLLHPIIPTYQLHPILPTLLPSTFFIPPMLQTSAPYQSFLKSYLLHPIILTYLLHPILPTPHSSYNLSYILLFLCLFLQQVTLMVNEIKVDVNTITKIPNVNTLKFILKVTSSFLNLQCSLNTWRSYHDYCCSGTYCCRLTPQCPCYPGAFLHCHGVRWACKLYFQHYAGITHWCHHQEWHIAITEVSKEAAGDQQQWHVTKINNIL